MKHTFVTEGKYIDSVFEIYTQGDTLHIVQHNKEHETERTYDVGRVALNADEFFRIYEKLAKDRDQRFDVVAQYASMLMNMSGRISLQTARELWRVATHQVDNFLVLTGNNEEVFRMLAIEDPQEQLRLEENFGDQVVASCRHRKVKIVRKGFKNTPKESRNG